MIPGIRVGHWTDLDAATGCTVVLCEQGAIAGVDVRGAAPATRETDLLRPGSLVGRAHAILLTGGSAFGLAAATGVMRFLEERGAGFPTQAGPVPIVPAAALFDLGIGRSDVRPTPRPATRRVWRRLRSIEEGCVGAGTGATVAKLGGPGGAIKSGIGMAAQTLADGTRIAALIAVNAVGAVYEPRTGAPVAVPRTSAAGWRPFGGTNTTIGVIATTAPLDPAGVNRLATIGHDGLALAIRPAHTVFDGDTLFALSLPAPDAVPPTLQGRIGARTGGSRSRRRRHCARGPRRHVAPRRAVSPGVTPTESEVLDQVTRLTDDMVAFTQDLVRIPTVNPPGDCYTHCAEFIARKLQDLGYTVETLPAEGLPEHTPEHPRLNVIGTLNSGRNTTLHFNGHYDVVPAGSGWTVDPFGGELRDGRIYGRGTCDQKAGIAASIYAVEAIRRAGIRSTARSSRARPRTRRAADSRAWAGCATPVAWRATASTTSSSPSRSIRSESASGIAGCTGSS